MSFNYSFRFAEDEQDIFHVVDFVEDYPWNYKGFDIWVNDKLKPELLSGVKKLIMGFSDGVLVANLIFQRHKIFDWLMEPKNMRVHPQISNRYFGVFMFRQMEVEARNSGFKGVLCDVRSDKKEMINLLKFMGYDELFRTSLYENNIEDAVFTKKFEMYDTGIFSPVKRKILEISV